MAISDSCGEKHFFSWNEHLAGHLEVVWGTREPWWVVQDLPKGLCPWEPPTPSSARTTAQLVIETNGPSKWMSRMSLVEILVL